MVRPPASSRAPASARWALPAWRASRAGSGGRPCRSPSALTRGMPARPSEWRWARPSASRWAGAPLGARRRRRRRWHDGRRGGRRWLRRRGRSRGWGRRGDEHPGRPDRGQRCRLCAVALTARCVEGVAVTAGRQGDGAAEHDAGGEVGPGPGQRKRPCPDDGDGDGGGLAAGGVAVADREGDRRGRPPGARGRRTVRKGDLVRRPIAAGSLNRRGPEERDDDRNERDANSVHGVAWGPVADRNTASNWDRMAQRSQRGMTPMATFGLARAAVRCCDSERRDRAQRPDLIEEWPS